jgi:hypothetical protein
MAGHGAADASQWSCTASSTPLATASSVDEIVLRVDDEPSYGPQGPRRAHAERDRQVLQLPILRVGVIGVFLYLQLQGNPVPDTHGSVRRVDRRSSGGPYENVAYPACLTPESASP